MKHLQVACAFLTRIPVGGVVQTAADIGRASPYFPIVGALVGAISAAACELAAWVWPGSAMLVATIAVIATVCVTGALHQDALADVADSTGGLDREARLEIMRDSRIGAYGTIALILALGLRVAAIAALVGSGHAAAWLVAAAALGRWAALPLAWTLPYARVEEPGLGRAVSDHIGATQVAWGLLLAGLIVFACIGASTLVAVGCSVAIAVAARAWFWRRIRGVTGDALGAVTELTEVAILLLGAAVEAST